MESEIPMEIINFSNLGMIPQENILDKILIKKLTMEVKNLLEILEGNKTVQEIWKF